MVHLKISLIAAIGSHRELGKDNKLLWSIPEDMHHFKQITWGHPVVMGRKTFESIGKPLDGRLNIILTKEKDFHPEGCFIAHSIPEAVSLAESRNAEEVFFIGGGDVYHQTIKMADKLYLTVVEGKYDADTYFPDYSEFKKVHFQKKVEYKDYKYTFLELSKL